MRGTTISDNKRKRIVADYIEHQSYNAVAKLHGISATTVKKYVLEDTEIVELCEQKKAENTQDMLTFMESRKYKAQTFVDKCLDNLNSAGKLDKASVIQVATAMGIVIDKFTQKTDAGEDALTRLDNILKEFSNAVKPEAN